MRNRRDTRKKTIVHASFLNKNFRIKALVLIAIVVLLFVGLQYKKREDERILAEQAKELEKQTGEMFEVIETDLSQVEQTEEASVSTARISAVGDILCQMDMIEDAKNNGEYNFDSMFSNIEEYVKDSDLAIGTLETNFVDTNYSGAIKCNSPIEFLTAIKKSGISLVSIAQNHELDYGESGLNETIQRLREQEISITGLANNEENENSQFTGNIKEINGIKIAFLAYTYGLSNEEDISDEEKQRANIYTEELAKEDLEYAEANSNYIIVIMHWGEVNSTQISEYQKSAANFLIENGADMILGGHPSVVQPMEIVQTAEEKNVLVAYSLGNYISTYTKEDADVAIILNVQIAKSSKSEKAVLQKVDYTPIYMLDNGTNAENRFELTDMKKLARDYANGDTSKISKKTYNRIIEKLERLDEIITKQN